MDTLQTRTLDADDFFRQPTPEKKIAFLLQYAVLAPSTHNSQPWRFKVRESACDIMVHDEHPIVHADPLGRDLFISFGCLIENLAIAARAFGVLGTISYIDRHPLIATVTFDFSAQKKDPSLLPVLTAIPRRVNARGLFEKDPIDAESWDTFERLPITDGLHRHFLKTPAEMATIAELTRQGLLMAYRNKKFRKEMAAWFNNGLSKKPTGIPSYSLRMPLPLSFVFPWLVRTFDVGKRLGSLNAISINSAPAAMVITASENSKRHWLKTGRFAEQFVLQANMRGCKTSFFTAAIEMGELYKDIQKLLQTNEIPQFIVVFGALHFDQKPNLRHSAESKIIK